MWQNSKTRIVIKLKNSNGDKTQKIKLWQNSKTQNVTKLNLWQNSTCDKTQIVTKFKLCQASNCEKKIKTQMWQNLDCDKTWELKLWQLKTQIVTKLEKLKLGQDFEYDKSQFIKTKKTFIKVF